MTVKSTHVAMVRVKRDSRSPSENPAESDLAQRAAEGDRLSQRRLFQLLKPGLHATFYRLMGSNAHLEDLLQDTFVEVFRSLPSYRGDARLSTWADRIAVRVAYRHFGKERARNLSAAAAPELSVVRSTDDDFVHREGVRRLYRALGEMKPAYRIAFALFVVDGRSLKEIATTTGVSVVAVKSRVWRARRELTATAESDPILARYLSSAETEES